MKAGVLSRLVAVLLVAGSGVTYAADPISEKQASPTLKERLTTDIIQGTLRKTEGAFYYIKDNAGKEQWIHVDKSTKVDNVMPGDKVKAYVTDQGHTTTLERVN